MNNYTAEEIGAFMGNFPNFTWDEIRCPCDHVDCEEVPIFSPEFKSFMLDLQGLRDFLQFPFHMTSVYRCPAYNDMIYVRDFEAKTGEHLDGPHTKGAGDMVVAFERMYKLVDEAMDNNMGVGIKQHGGVSQRFVHLDSLGTRLWTYP